MNIKEIELEFEKLNNQHAKLLLQELHAKCIVACKLLGVAELSVYSMQEDRCDFLNIEFESNPENEILHLNSLLEQNGIPVVRDIDFINIFPDFKITNIGLSTSLEHLLSEPFASKLDTKGNSSLEL